MGGTKDRINIPTPPPGFLFMAFNGDKACSKNFCAAELFVAAMMAAISDDVAVDWMKAGLASVNMSTVYLAERSTECEAGCAGPTRSSRGIWLTNDTRASTNCARYFPTCGLPKWYAARAGVLSALLMKSMASSRLLMVWTARIGASVLACSSSVLLVGSSRTTALDSWMMVFRPESAFLSASRALLTRLALLGLPFASPYILAAELSLRLSSTTACRKSCLTNSLTRTRSGA